MQAAIVVLGVLGVLVMRVLVAPFGCDLRTRGIARMTRMAAEQWQSSAKSRACPSYADLVQAGLLDPQFAGTAASVRITCDQAEVAVRWAGPDGDFDTSDDEAVPDPLGDPRPPVLAGFMLPFVTLMGATLSLAVITIVAGLRGWSRTRWFAQLASASGWLVVGIGVAAGLVDVTVSQLAASRPSLSDADARRSIERGAGQLLTDAGISVLVGAPGILLGPLRSRRRRVTRANPSIA